MRNLIKGLPIVVALLAALVPLYAAGTTDFAEIASLPAKTTNFNGAGAQASFFSNPGPTTAPTAGATLVSSGNLAPGCYVIDVTIENETDTAANSVQCAHRNAANSADVSVALPIPVAAATPGVLASGIYEVLIANQNESVACRIVASATSAKVWQADMTGFPCP